MRHVSRQMSLSKHRGCCQVVVERGKLLSAWRSESREETGAKIGDGSATVGHDEPDAWVPSDDAGSYGSD